MKSTLPWLLSPISVHHFNQKNSIPSSSCHYAHLVNVDLNSQPTASSCFSSAYFARMKKFYLKWYLRSTGIFFMSSFASIITCEKIRDLYCMMCLVVSVQLRFMICLWICPVYLEIDFFNRIELCYFSSCEIKPFSILSNSNPVFETSSFCFFVRPSTGYRRFSKCLSYSDTEVFHCPIMNQHGKIFIRADDFLGLSLLYEKLTLRF